MANPVRILRLAVISGSLASASSTATLALLARKEGKNALQPVNSTSHWLNGEKAALFTGIDLAHTAVGYATHHAATIFWAIFFERWIGPRRPLGAVPMLRDALILSAVAAAVDYGATPRRFTPGWELVLSKSSMIGAYIAMAAGLAAGALMTQKLARPSSAVLAS